ncbi:MAG: hypothetical protein WB562_15280 [Candidatus Sulfotelmatobacter sp.]
MEIIDIFLKAGRVKRDEDHEMVVAPGRNRELNSYAKVFHDELLREDMKLARLDYPEQIVDPRRRQELADGGMVREDRKSMANLSNTAIHHEYPRLKYYSTPYIGSLARVKSKSSRRQSGDK